MIAAGPDARNETGQPKPLDLEVGDRRKSMLEDIAILTGGTAMSEDLGIKLENVALDMLGRARRVTVEKENTTIVDGAGKKEQIQRRVTQIKTQIEETISDWIARSCRSGWPSSPGCRRHPRRRLDGGRGQGTQGLGRRRHSCHPCRGRGGHPARRRGAAQSRQGTRGGRRRQRRPEIRPRYRAARHRSSRAPDRGEQRGKPLHRHRQAARGCTYGSDAQTGEFGDLFGQGVISA